MDSLIETYADGKCRVVSREDSRKNFKFCPEAYNKTARVDHFRVRIGKQRIKDRAKDAANTRGRGMPVVSKHVSASGTRQYYVSSWESAFIRVFSRLHGPKKSIYENIYIDDLCRLYVDVDFGYPPALFPAPSREDLTVEERTTELKDALERIVAYLNAYTHNFIGALKDIFHKVYPDVLCTDIYLQDATSEKKFSKHLIIHLNDDEARFKSSADVGAFFGFIKRALYNITKNNGMDTAADNFFFPLDLETRVFGTSTTATKVEEEEEKETPALYARNFMADEIVYGNTSREFRTLGSTKYGERRHLVLKSHLQLPPGDIEERRMLASKPGLEGYTSVPLPEEDCVKRWDIFAQNLICYIPEDKDITRVLTFDTKTPPPNVNSAFAECPTTTTTEELFSEANKKKPTTRTSCSTTTGIKLVEEFGFQKVTLLRSYEKFPDQLKALFDSVYNEHKRSYIFELVAADIKSQTGHLASETLECVRYTIIDNMYVLTYGTSCHYCEIRLGEHTKNHVFYNVQLGSKCYYQRCWNEGCVNTINKGGLGMAPWYKVDTPQQATHDAFDDDDNEDENDQNDRLKRQDMAQNFQHNVDQPVQGTNLSVKAQTRTLSEHIWEPIQMFVNEDRLLKKLYTEFLDGTYQLQLMKDHFQTLNTEGDCDVMDMDMDMDTDMDMDECKVEETLEMKPILSVEEMKQKFGDPFKTEQTKNFRARFLDKLF